MTSYQTPASAVHDLHSAQQQIRRLERNEFASDLNSPFGAALGQLRVNVERLGRHRPVPGSSWVLLAEQIAVAGGFRR